MVQKHSKSRTSIGYNLERKTRRVLLSPGDYDELVYKKAFLDSVGRGLADTESGNVYSTKELKAALIERRTGR